MKRGFSLTIHSSNRHATDTIYDYRVDLQREYLGDFMVKARVAAFAATGNDTLELGLRGDGIMVESSDPKDPYREILTMTPALQGGEGVFYVNGAFRGPIWVRWRNQDGEVVTDEFGDHTIYLHFTPVCD